MQYFTALLAEQRERRRCGPVAAAVSTELQCVTGRRPCNHWHRERHVTSVRRKRGGNRRVARGQHDERLANGDVERVADIHRDDRPASNRRAGWRDACNGQGFVDKRSVCRGLEFLPVAADRHAVCAACEGADISVKHSCTSINISGRNANGQNTRTHLRRQGAAARRRCRWQR